MKTQSLGWLVGLAAAASSFMSCAEPAAQCQVGLAGNNPYAALFTVKGTAPACAAMSPGIQAIMNGDLVGMEFYNEPQPGNANGYDPNKTVVAVKLDTVGQEFNTYSGYACAPAACGAGACGVVADGCGATQVWPAWAGMTMYNVGDEVTNGDNTYVCVAAGTSDPSSTATGPTGTGTNILDGSAKWNFVVASTSDCGTCPNAGDTCGGGGMPSMCGQGKTCTPATCMSAGANCGPIGDGCGGMIESCGTCSGNTTCGGGGTPSVCGFMIYPGSACTTDSDCTGVGKCDPTMHTCTTTNQPYTLASAGFANQFPDSNNMCQATFTGAEQDVSSGPMASSMFPLDSIKYNWSNLNVYVTPADQGTEFEADLAFTENGCSVNFHAVGLWPQVDCTDTSGAMPVPDPTLCNPCAVPSLMRFTGSGISPDYKTTCKQIIPMGDAYGRDPFYCVPAAPTGLPQLDPNPPTCQGADVGQPCTQNTDCASNICVTATTHGATQKVGTCQ